MSPLAPTPEQAAAIAAGGHDTLLEAGAGTGKTGVMVDRYCRLVCEEAVAPEEILAFTFTDKAAAELRQRIRAELAAAAEGPHSGAARAREALERFGGAQVTTIHGFCNRLLAAHPVAAGLDPRFRVLDAAEAERAAREAFDAALEDFLAEPDESREETVAAYRVDGLRAMVLAAHAELRSRGAAEPALPSPPEPDIGAALRRAADAAAAALAEMKPTNSNRELLERALATLSDSEPGRLDLDRLVGLRSNSKAQALREYCEAIEALVARVAEAGEGGAAYRHVGTLLRLFSDRFERVKESRSGVDFEDLQILAIRLLERTEIGDAYRRRLRHLMVDEFQDTNRLQLRLIDALRGPRCELTVVGDELQSIYGFRHADLEVFRGQRREMEERPSARVMELSGNFRSRPEVIGAVNLFGKKLFGDAFHPLRVGAPPSAPLPGEGAAVELLLTAKAGWDAPGIELEPAVDDRTPPHCLAEARAVAERLRELADAGVKRGDMVVLLRAFTHLNAYEDSLERAGLRPYVVGGRGYWSQQQVADVRALLATIANPLDDLSLFGALASGACGVAPDTLWLLRAAAGRERHVWPAVERAAGLRESEVADPGRLEQIPDDELALLARFAETLRDLRRRAPRLSLAALIDAAITETGYDLAVLMRPAGEARFANVRKLMSLAQEFEAREGRDLRRFLDFLAFRGEADSEALAATAAEDHDGVRVMTIHNAKGLEFEVVAVPDLSRGLLAGGRAPLLTLGRDGSAGLAGMQLRRLGASAINLYSYEELREEEKRRDSEEGLRLFYVAATRARSRLILSGVVDGEGGREVKPGTPVIERLVDALGIDRNSDSSVPVPAPEPRAGLEARFADSEIGVRVNLPSPERAAELTARRPPPQRAAAEGVGKAPLVERRAPTVPSRPLSYSALSRYEACPYRFYLERVLGLGGEGGNGEGDGLAEGPREERAAEGAAVHSLLEWSRAHGWSEPPEETIRLHASAQHLDPQADGLLERIAAAVDGWLRSSLLAEIARSDPIALRAEAPILLGVEGSVLRGSIDLLVERRGAPPLVVDYKTDRLDGADPAEHAARYELQRAIYALAVADARGAAEVEVAYVFLERPEEPVITLLGRAELEAGRRRLAAAIRSIGAGEFPAAAGPQRSWSLCSGCPGLRGTCSGPQS